MHEHALGLIGQVVRGQNALDLAAFYHISKDTATDDTRALLRPVSVCETKRGHVDLVGLDGHAVICGKPQDKLAVSVALAPAHLVVDVDDDELAAMIARVYQCVQQRDAVSASADRDGDAPELREPRRNILFDEFDHNYIIYQIRARRKAISGHMRCLGGAYFSPFGQQLRYAKNFRKNLYKTPRKKADGGECCRERV